jgi:flagellar biosynthetic protein FliR
MELLTGRGTVVLALLVMRLTGLVLVAPVFSARVVPMRVRTAVLVVLALVLWPAAADAAGPLERLTAPAVLNEGLIGLVVGMGAAVFVAAAETAGATLAIQMGLSGASLLDPMTRSQTPVLGNVLGLTVLAFLVALGGHVLIIESLEASLRIVPPGAPVDPAGGVRAVFQVGTLLFALGLRFAAPVVGAMVIGNAALGVVARTVPQLNVLMVAFPVQIAVGLFTLAAALPLMATYFTNWSTAYTSVLDGLLGGLLPGGGR